MRSTARSAITIVGALVLPRKIVGIAVASMMRRRLDSEHAQFGVDDGADRAAGGGVKEGQSGMASEREQV
jgi:hypothetical protein